MSTAKVREQFARAGFNGGWAAAHISLAILAEKQGNTAFAEWMRRRANEPDNVEIAETASGAQEPDAETALADALETFVRDSDVSLESLERVAEEFHRETGFLAPGKDEAAAVNSGVTQEQRRAAWNEWSGKRVRARLEAARKALALAGRKP